MNTLRAAIGIAWLVFWVYWLLAAFGAKRGSGNWRRVPLNGVTAICVYLLVRVFRGGSLMVQSPIVGAIGALVFASGLALAVWARLHLGRNWGMPMTQKEEPDLVTSGPYRFVRHPIYSGLLCGLLGTALANNLLGLIIAVLLGAYFYYAASVEERNLTATFPIAVSGVPLEHQEAHPVRPVATGATISKVGNGRLGSPLCRAPTCCCTRSGCASSRRS